MGSSPVEQGASGQPMSGLDGALPQAESDVIQSRVERRLYRPAIAEALVREILASMARVEAHGQGPFAERRSSTRYPYATKFVLVVPCEPPEVSGTPVLAAFGTWGRNISGGGLAALVSKQVCRITGSMNQHETIDAATLVRQHSVCYCGLPKHDAQLLWVRSRIVRVRHLDDPVLEVGLQFLEKSSTLHQAFVSDLLAAKQGHK